MASRGVNKVILVGNLGQDPEVRYMPNGGAVANITLATSESWRDKATGEQKEKTEWHRVVLFGKLAEVAGEYLRKGSQVYIEGSLQTRKWQDQSGQDRYTTEIVVNVGGTMQMLGGRQGGGAPAGQSAGGQGGWASLSSHRAATSSAAASSSLARRRTAHRRPAATNRQWISTTISHSKVRLENIAKNPAQAGFFYAGLRAVHAWISNDWKKRCGGENPASAINRSVRSGGSSSSRCCNWARSSTGVRGV